MKIDRGEIRFSRDNDTDWFTVSFGAPGIQFAVSAAFGGDRENDHLRVAKTLRSLALRLERNSDRPLMSGVEKHDLIRVPFDEASAEEVWAGSNSVVGFARMPRRIQGEISGHLRLEFERDWQERLDCVSGLGPCNLKGIPEYIWFRSTLRLPARA